jgi:hypothetical protein
MNHRREPDLDGYVLEDNNVDLPFINLSSKLRKWATEFHIKCNAVNSLLDILRDFHPDFPKDYRTFLKTPRCTVISEIFPGRYCHVGVRKCLDYVLSNLKILPSSIVIDIGIDGAKFDKKADSKCYWPILGRVKIQSTVFIFPIAIWYGRGKPDDPNDFLREFVDEWKNDVPLYSYLNKKIDVTIGVFITDGPAKAYILGVKSHGGYFSCPDCEIPGVNIDGRVVYLGLNYKKRTDADFRNMIDQEHHKRHSILTELSINMVDRIVVDFMHCLCMGVVNKFLTILFGKKPIYTKPTQNSISSIINSIESTQPPEFQRKIRALNWLFDYKASEFRTFLLYIGPFVLKDQISDEHYNLFLKLHVSTFILCHSDFHLLYNDLAHVLFCDFIQDFAEIFGESYISYNFHMLSHLAEESKKNGPLDEFSAFPFESFLGRMKYFISSKNNQLEQISNRVSEMFACSSTPSTKRNQDNKNILLKKPLGNDEYKELQYFGCQLNSDIRNCLVLLKKKVVIKIEKIFTRGEKILAIAKEFLLVEDFYDFPVHSSELGIFKCCSSNLSVNRKYKLKDFHSKMFGMHSENFLVVIPMTKFDRINYD